MSVTSFALLLPWCVYETEVGVFLKSSGLSFPQIRLWLLPVFSHDTLQVETLEILQSVAKRQKANFIYGVEVSHTHSNTYAYSCLFRLLFISEQHTVSSNTIPIRKWDTPTISHMWISIILKNKKLSVENSGKYFLKSRENNPEDDVKYNPNDVIRVTIAGGWNIYFYCRTLYDKLCVWRRKKDVDDFNF